MSSERPEKRKKYHNACDECRKKKTKCDSEMMPENICSSCLNLKVKCTHDMARQRRGPKPGFTRTDAFLPIDVLVSNILCGTKSNPFVIPEEEEVTRKILVRLAKRVQDLENELKRHRQGYTMKTSSQMSDTTTETSPPIQDHSLDHSSNITTDTADVDALSKQLSQFSLGPQSKTHFGESSVIMLVLDAMDHKKQMNGSTSPDWGSIFTYVSRPEFWDYTPSSWSRITSQASPFDFPPPNLLHQFINAYFVEYNIYSPLLHWPTFEKSISQNLHLHDESFGAVVLAVCALGARIVSPTPVKDKPGDRWFNQIRIEKYVFRETLELYHLQLYCLCLFYFRCIVTGFDGAWLLSGIAIRRAHEKGIHRRYAQSVQQPTGEGELWKRAFWMLITIETNIMTTLYGRPGATSIQDFDLDPLVECDDEYWEPQDATQAFIQPPDRPSTVSYWNSYLKLTEIYGFCLMTIYSVRKSKLGSKMGVNSQDWCTKTVMELDSALNKWIDSVPEHLRWDEEPKSPIFLGQSVLLYAAYHWIQIQVHRPFIPRPGQTAAASPSPSLAICTNAARSCIRVCEVYSQRASMHYSEFLGPLYNSAIVLALNMMRATQLKLKFDPAKEVEDIRKCLRVMSLYESRFPLAGRFVDMINMIMFASHHVPRSLNSATSSSWTTSGDMTNYASQSNSTRNITTTDTPGFSFDWDPSTRDLSPYSNELGELPVHRMNSPLSYTCTGPLSHSSYDHDSDIFNQPVPFYGELNTEDPASLEQSFDHGQYFSIPHDQSESTLHSNEVSINLTEQFSCDTAPAISIWPDYPSQDWEVFMASVDQLFNTATIPPTGHDF
ncbi:hypothetical protein K435DRAFT_839398 [Dendrothele bispora CBS 962.96]|uniref:Zn(2)-C6 fungal-type domain-containing protein n=1 Tax=Dendrothele bispora (strain CBS 962.96) TaxID=1314807 RepID=A0A4S8M1W3_DENBC|nr:hypothetical protein K435DRAFT_839398 [Dendrothele bispora CBS 962.96]